MKLPYILFDIGGSKTRLSISHDGKSFDEPIIYQTPQNFEEGMHLLIKSIRDLSNEKIGIICGGVAGPLSLNKTGVINAPNIVDYNDKNISEKLSHEFGSEVYLQNDTALVGLGEAISGAGSEWDIVAYITISTGIGGVKISDKKIDENILGFEIGHQIIELEHGRDLEAFASGTGIKNLYGRSAEEIDDENLWNDITRNLSIGIHNTILHWSPNGVVLGGSVMSKINIDNIKAHLNETLLKVFPKVPEVKKAELGDIGGIYGALHYISDNTRI